MRRQTSSSAPCTTHDDRIPCNESDRLASMTHASYTLHRDTRQQDRRPSRQNHRLLHCRRQKRSGRRLERELGMLRGTWWFRFVQGRGWSARWITGFFSCDRYVCLWWFCVFLPWCKEKNERMRLGDMVKLLLETGIFGVAFLMSQRCHVEH